MPDSNLTLLIWSTSFWTQPLAFKHPEQFKINVAFSILGYFLFLGSTWKVVYIYNTWDLLSYRTLSLFPLGHGGGGWGRDQRIGLGLSKRERQKDVCHRDLTPWRYYEQVQINTTGKNIMGYACFILSCFLPCSPILFTLSLYQSHPQHNWEMKNKQREQYKLSSIPAGII